MAGRPNIPTAMKVLKGTARKDRTLPNEMNPKLARIPKPAPNELNAEGKAEWEKIYRELVEVGVMTVIDDSMLFTYCNEFGKYLELEKKLNGNNGRTVENVAGNIVVSADELLAQKCLKEARTTAMQFGLTPSSRTRIPSGIKQGKDDFDNI